MLDLLRSSQYEDGLQQSIHTFQNIVDEVSLNLLREKLMPVVIFGCIIYLDFNPWATFNQCISRLMKCRISILKNEAWASITDRAFDWSILTLKNCVVYFITGYQTKSCYFYPWSIYHQS